MNNDNRVWQWAGHLIMIVVSVACIVPFVLLFISSITDERMIIQNGYSFFPGKLSAAAYVYLYDQSEQILRAYGITILVTLIGTTASLVMTSLLAYPLSRRDLPHHNKLAFFVFFTLLFNGGLVPTYLIYAQYLDIKNTIWALIIPGLLMNGFNVLLMRTFFKTSIPVEVLESAYIDGAGEFRTFCSIVLPLSLPIMATIGLFQTIGYWNDWFNGLIYLNDARLFSIQNILNRILTDIQFLTNGSMGTNASQGLAALPSATVRMAIAVIGVLPILIAYPFFQKYFVKGITIGAVKG